MELSSEDKVTQRRINSILPHLNERQSRIYLGAEAQSIGRGGISKIHRLTKVNRKTISSGQKEIEQITLNVTTASVDTATLITEGEEIEQVTLNVSPKKSRIRKPGGGRKKTIEKNPMLLEDLRAIINPYIMGDPESPLLWCSKSSRKIEKVLREQGYQISHETTRKCLKTLGLSLQSNKKTKEGADHPDRDAQFEYINSVCKEFLSAGDPVISVDCKKKELIGDYKNNGREWTPVEYPTEVNVYDFLDKTNGKAAPYGVYDIGKNRGWVSVGISSETSSFAVSTINSWWEGEGMELYPESKRLYINADGGGSNGSRNKLWKEELQNFSNKHNLEVHVSHFPPGTSKWNKIEHRLFSEITMNWRAKPLTSLLVIISLIGATTTTTGLTVTAVLDEKKYQTGIKITDEQMKKWNIEKNEFQGKWNYIIRPNLE